MVEQSARRKQPVNLFGFILDSTSKIKNCTIITIYTEKKEQIKRIAYESKTL